MNSYIFLTFYSMQTTRKTIWSIIGLQFENSSQRSLQAKDPTQPSCTTKCRSLSYSSLTFKGRKGSGICTRLATIAMPNTILCKAYNQQILTKAVLWRTKLTKYSTFQEQSFIAKREISPTIFFHRSFLDYDQGWPLSWLSRWRPPCLLVFSL